MIVEQMLQERRDRFFTWVSECCVLLGWKKEDGEKLLPAKDISWYFCFDDGMTPEQAVDEAVAKGIVSKSS